MSGKSMSDNTEALRRLWPIIEKALGGLVFTADKAGEVAADMATVRAALAQQAATPTDPEDDGVLTVAYMAGRYDGRKAAAQPAEPDTERERAAFEADAEPMGFDLTRQQIAVPEPWAEYWDTSTGNRWGGWLARAALEGR